MRRAEMVRADIAGFCAIGLWSMLAVLTASSGAIPPFQLTAWTFGIGAALGMASWAFRPRAVRALRQPLGIWALGVGGLFGYHALYFAALRLAPPAEAGLIAYLWPLLIVLFSGLILREPLKTQHLGGALLGLGGVITLFAGRGGGLGFATQAIPGYFLALACALVWSLYSVLSRRHGTVPTDAVVGFCLATAVLSAACHLVFETTSWPREPRQWLAIAGLGLGPVGSAFYLWDYGVKHGDIRLIGVASYAAPVLSTLILVAAGFASPSLSLVAAAGLIVGGALIAARA